MTIAGGIAAALFHRERTGEASVVDVSLLGTAMWVMAPDIVREQALARGHAGAAVGAAHEAPNPIVNSYRTKDGRWLFLEHAAARPLLGGLLPRHRPRRHDRPIRASRAAWRASRIARRASPSSTRRSRRARSPSGARASTARGRVGADADGARGGRRPAGARERLPAGGGPRRRRPLHARASPVQFDETRRRCGAAPNGASTPKRCCWRRSGSRWTSWSSSRVGRDS